MSVFTSDGRHTHYMATRAWRCYTAGFLAVRGRDPGVTVSVGF
jgi:hypothetical protein